MTSVISLHVSHPKVILVSLKTDILMFENVCNVVVDRFINHLINSN